MKHLALLLLLFCAGCHRTTEDHHPKLSYAVQDRYLQALPSAFPPLSPHERSEDWGRELTIGRGFAKELDLYSAIATFKRSQFLLPDGTKDSLRSSELNYDIFLAYYLGQKYDEAIYTFGTTSLWKSESNFPAFHDLMVALYDVDLRTEVPIEERNRILLRLQPSFPETAHRLAYSGALIEANFEQLEQFPEAEPLLKEYTLKKKSVGGAQALNALLPGAGYFYLGQGQSGITAFLLNGLFIWATIHFFQHGHVAAGAITASFEAGWYFGGIYGAGQEARFYNERLYETIATPMMQREKLFPVLMLQCAF
jgi:TM2 domain-containing membrane protein YozV